VTEQTLLRQRSGERSECRSYDQREDLIVTI